MNMKGKIKDVLNEAMEGSHFMERVYDRFLDREEIPVGYEISVGIYRTVGTFTFTKEQKEIITAALEKIKKKNYPKNKSYAIRLAKFNLKGDSVNYFTIADRIESKSEHVVFVDDTTNSNGDVLYVIVRNNKLVTIYFGKSYVQQTTHKMQVDYIINGIDNLDKIR